jgi:hypothetical protein
MDFEHLPVLMKDETSFYFEKISNLNHDSPSFFRADKSDQIVRRPSPEKQISSNARMSDAREGRERSCGFRVKKARS